MNLARVRRSWSGTGNKPAGETGSSLSANLNPLNRMLPTFSGGLNFPCLLRLDRHSLARLKQKNGKARKNCRREVKSSCPIGNHRKLLFQAYWRHYFLLQYCNNFQPGLVIMVDSPGYLDKIKNAGWAINSVAECYLHTVEVRGSNPLSPTIFFYPQPERRGGRSIF